MVSVSRLHQGSSHGEMSCKCLPYSRARNSDIFPWQERLNEEVRNNEELHEQVVSRLESQVESLELMNSEMSKEYNARCLLTGPSFPHCQDARLRSEHQCFVFMVMYM